MLALKSGEHKPQVDKQKLRGWLENQKIYYTKHINLCDSDQFSVECEVWRNRLYSTNKAIKKLDAGDFDVKID